MSNEQIKEALISKVKAQYKDIELDSIILGQIDVIIEYLQNNKGKSIQDERVLLDLEKVMYNYIYKNTIPDPYVETEKRKRIRKKNK